LTDKPKLTYCFKCNKDTQTVLKKNSKLIQGILGKKERHCKDCGKLKEESEVEMEE
jgi:hypothetical protein